MRGGGTAGVLGCVALIAAGSLLTGCVATEAPLPARGVTVSGPPPAPIAEVQRSAPPSASAVWIVGYWHWTGMQYAWIPGHWENAPPGAAWNAPRYVSADGTYFYEAGTWKPSATGRTTANALH